MDEGKKENTENNQEITFSEFLERIPPGKTVKIKPFHGRLYGGSYWVILPTIQLNCDNELCKGKRFFKSRKTDIGFVPKNFQYEYLRYCCRNCQKNDKIFSVAIILSEKRDQATAFKLGEYPAFGPPTPSKLVELIGPEKDHFLMGRRCENQGMGIGAFVYYRRVIENQKNRIFDKIIQVLKKIKANENLIQELDKAKEETQFSKAVESIKYGLPDVLLVNGHNPLTLLHKALSEGVHDKTDEECLEIAGSIRIVLSELAEKLAQALKDEAELKQSIAKLLNRKDKKI